MRFYTMGGGRFFVHARQPRRGMPGWRAMLAAAMFGLVPACVVAAPAVGDVYVYRVSNGYVSGGVLGRVRHRIEKVGADSIEASLSADNPRVGTARVEITTREGNWLRRQMNNHDHFVDYEFARPFPAYAFPLEPGKDWSMRVEGVSAATGRRNSVRVDGEILAAERITVPAGTFDVLKVRRRIYAGDADGEIAETTIVELDWFAPALGRTVRAESKAEWMDYRRCGESCRPQLGDWLVYELVEAPPARP